MTARHIPAGWRGTDELGRHQCLACWGWRHPVNHSCPGVPQAGRTPPPKPQRIQRSRQRGWRMPSGARYVGRPGPFGNPFKVIRGQRTGQWRVVDTGDRSRTLREEPQYVPDQWAGAVMAVRLFELHTGPLGLYEWDDVEEVRRELAGQDLVCWCPLVDADGQPVPCHADVLLELAASPGRVV